MKKMKVKVNNLSKVYVLEKFGEITYVDDMMKIVFIRLDQQALEEVEELAFVENISTTREGSLLTV